MGYWNTWFGRNKVKDYEVTLKSNAGFATFVIKIKRNAYTFDLFIFPCPTSNCQLSSIGSMNFLLQYTNNNKEDVHAILKECYSLLKINMKAILIDVQKAYIPGMELCFDKVLMKKSYVSTNKSEMCIFIVTL